MQHIQDNLSAHYKLTADIDCSETSAWNANPDEWVDGVVGGTLTPDSYAATTHTDIIVENNGYSGFEPIGIDSVFSGSLDGDGHTISHLWIFRKTAQNVGLFSTVQYATITNLTLTDSNIVGGQNTGGIVGYADSVEASHVTLRANMVRAYLTVMGGGFAGQLLSGTLDHIENNEGYVHGSGNIIGGIVGYMQNGTITDSFSSAAVDGGLMIGGFVGEMDNGEIMRSYATGEVTVNASEYVVMKTGAYGGGFVAYMAGGTIANSYATGDVTSSGTNVGGFVGYVGDGTISESYATGNTSGIQEVFDNATFTSSYVGGFAGFVSGSHIYKTYALGNVTNVGSYTGGYAGYIATAVVHDAYQAGTVTGESGVGGFAGHLSENNDVVNVYARGVVVGQDANATAGLIGAPENGVTPAHSFWDTETVGLPTTGAPEEKTTLEMKTQNTFTDAGWDFDTVWKISEGINGGYPALLFSLIPNVSSVTPSDSAVDVAITAPVTIQFSIPMDTESVVISNSNCGYACNTYTQVWSNNNKTLTLTKVGDPFVYDATYTISITSAASADGTALSEPFSWSFTIRAAEVTTSWTHRRSGSYVNTNILAALTAPSQKTIPAQIPTIPASTICSAGVYPTKVIKFGAANDPAQVRLLQQYLNIFEHTTLAVDGIYSEEDRAAVIVWQEKYAADILAPWGLTKGTGYIFKTSLQKFKSVFLSQCATVLNGAVPENKQSSGVIVPRILRIGMSGVDVKSLQQALIVKMVGPAARALESHKATGYFGNLTKKALIEFQLSAHILPATGNYGPKTRGVLKI